MFNRLLNKLFKPKWSKAPVWAKWLGVDNGRWKWFDCKPLPGLFINHWRAFEREQVAGKFYGRFPVIGNLEKKPEKESG